MDKSAEFKDDLPMDGMVSVKGYDYPLKYRGYLSANPNKCCVNTGDENIWVARSRISVLSEEK